MSDREGEVGTDEARLLKNESNSVHLKTLCQLERMKHA
jgi:hypothetical protein